MENTPNSEGSVEDKQETTAQEAVTPVLNEENAPTTQVGTPVATQLADSGIINKSAKSLRALALKTLLGAMIGTAVVTVIIILLGSWSGTAWRAIWTMIVAVIHLLIVLGLTSSTMHARDERSARSSNSVLNSSLLVTVISFFVTVASTWGIVSGAELWRWYVSFVVVMFASLHMKAFYDMEEIASVRKLTNAYYAVIGFTAFLIIGWVMIQGLGDILGGFFVRLVAATVVSNVTMGIVIAVMRRLYYQQHPEAHTAKAKQSSSSAVAIIVLLVCLLFYGIPLLLGILIR